MEKEIDWKKYYLLQMKSGNTEIQGNIYIFLNLEKL